ncbi:CCR4-Not complex component, Not1 protein [Cardiosporidium cionae]|uniref:CCR4-Not complex component, Not1 protein n=1 Tax=Cardiosporidium cionae TaxID=476202 RepID=A0ABQ7J8V2_9APIC|nr:CCR4-Not complex component, Not1 protein [Cardiosporidium cionae]|eukprot:KAF8820431.1 CCR4-Not complex component, Not1 protein [Cardiosporidium cionae]
MHSSSLYASGDESAFSFSAGDLPSERSSTKQSSPLERSNFGSFSSSSAAVSAHGLSSASLNSISIPSGTLFSSGIPSREMALHTSPSEGGEKGGGSDLSVMQTKFPPIIEAEVNIQFRKFYASEITMTQMLDLLKRLSTFPQGTHESNVFNAMLNTLFAECRFFPKYPQHELAMTAELFGKMILNDLLLSSGELFVMALRCIVEALRKGEHSKMFSFGFVALQQFIGRIPSFPLFASKLIEIPDLRKGYPSYVEYIETVLACLPDPVRNVQVVNPSVLFTLKLPEPPEISFQSSPEMPGNVQSLPLSENTGEFSQSFPGSTTAATSSSLLPSSSPLVTPSQRTLPPQILSLLQEPGLGQVEALMNDPEVLRDIEIPPEWFIDHIGNTFNTLSSSNIDEKAGVTCGLLSSSYYIWLCHYIVKSRAAKECNLHGIFLDFVDKLDQPKLLDIIVTMTSECLISLLKYMDVALPFLSYRTVLKNLGSWLGTITVARNRPLKLKNLPLKTILLEAYEYGRLFAVVPLVCKVLECVKHSKNFRPPNPWTTAYLHLLCEIHDLPDLRTGLVFEIEILFKNLDISMEEFRGQTDLLSKRTSPTSSSDFAIRLPVDTGPSLPPGGGPSPFLPSPLPPPTPSLPTSTAATGASLSNLTSLNDTVLPMVRRGSGGTPLPPFQQPSLSSLSMADFTKLRQYVRPFQQQGVPAAAPSSSPFYMVGGGGSGGSGAPEPALSSFAPPGISAPTAAYAAHSRMMMEDRVSIGPKEPPAMTGTHAETSSSSHSDLTLQNLSKSMVISPTVAVLQSLPQFRHFIPLAMDRAIKEIISAVVERSGTF